MSAVTHYKTAPEDRISLKQKSAYAVGMLVNNLQAAARLMSRNRAGSIINMTSVLGVQGAAGNTLYSASKAALIGMTRSAAKELGPQGIRVNAICPGYVRTPLVDGQIEDQAKTHGISREEVLEKVLLKKQAIKRMVEPSELGEAVIYLCSDAARCMTGTSLTIDCGWTAN